MNNSTLSNPTLEHIEKLIREEKFGIDCMVADIDGRTKELEYMINIELPELKKSLNRLQAQRASAVADLLECKEPTQVGIDYLSTVQSNEASNA